MRLVTNDKLIERQSKIARYATFGALAILLGSLVTSFNTAYIGLAYATLFVGMILAYVGSTLGNKWVKEPRADQALAKALKGFDNKHHLYNFFLPASHVLVTPTGVLVFLIKNHDGNISLANGKWTRAWSWGRLIGGMGQGALGNPLAELDAEITKLKKFLTDNIENSALIPVNGYAVFTDPRAQLTLDDKTVPVVAVDNLKDTLRKNKSGAALTPKLADQIIQLFDQAANGKATQ